MILILAVFLILTSTASAQYDDWQHSGSFYILTTSDGVELDPAVSVEGFPVVVRLHRDFFDFQEAQPTGSDLRFTSTDGKVLPHEIEEWDRENETASIWVRIPRVRGDETQEIRMHWGNPNVPSEADMNLVFEAENGFAGVWHLGGGVSDSSSNRLGGQNHGAARSPGILAQSHDFGEDQYIVAGEVAGDEVRTLPAGNSDRSMSAWIRPDRYDNGPTIGGWGAQGAQHLSYLTLSDRGRVKFHGYAADPEGVTQAPIGEWHHVAITITSGTIRFYFDGELEHQTAIRTLDTTSPSACFLGKHTPPGGPWSRPFYGRLDEVRFESVARDATWMRLCYENQRPLQRLVGPLVKDGDAIAIHPDELTLSEGETATIHADAGGARKIYWIENRRGTSRVVAVDQLTYTFEAGRVEVDEEVSITLRTITANGTRSASLPITIEESIAEPEFTLEAPHSWDGRTSMSVDLFTDQDLADFSCEWSTYGPATQRRTEHGRLVLDRAQGSGPLTVTVAIHNGGRERSRSVVIDVTEPLTDPWVGRQPGPNEKPTDHQFYARDDEGMGTLHCNGTLPSRTLETSPDEVILRVWSGDDLHATERTQPSEDGSYLVSARLEAKLVHYRIELVTRSGEQETVIHTASDILCGDAYLIQGQSNAEAFDGGRAVYSAAPGRNGAFVRSFGSPRSDPENARLHLWGDATGFDQDGWKLQIGYWGMALGIKLVEQQRIPICIINGAQGGTRIDQHQRNVDDPTDVSTIYGRLLWRVQEAGLTHGIRGVLWHQGENDQGSAGGAGRFGYENYANYFESLTASWKRDFPNVRHYHAFQIWPKACAMGTNGSDDRLREVQRRLPERYSNLSVMSTLGVRPPGGCHYPAEGYQQIADRIYPLVARDHYGATFEESIAPPDLIRAQWLDLAKTLLTLTFDQPVIWEDSLGSLFDVDGISERVDVGRGDGDRDRDGDGTKITLDLSGASGGERITYLVGDRFNPNKPILRGANGIAALTFCDVPIEEPPLTSPGARNARGDALLKAGRFDEAILDFDSYLAFTPDAEPYHWQRGIAYYYAGRYQEGVDQFDIHRTVNSADVENAVWHYLCKARIDGVQAARDALLPVGPDPRVPMMTVYELFAGRATVEDVERDAMETSSARRPLAMFYAHLYIALYYESFGYDEGARRHMNLASGKYGVPGYMGDIARMHAKWMLHGSPGAARD